MITKYKKLFEYIKFNLEFKRFILCGISAVIVDMILYAFLIRLGINISFSKAFSFSIGTIYSYFINKRWTFRTIGNIKIFFKYVLIYLLSLNININVNKFIFELLNTKTINTIFFAFLVSTIFSAIFNFIFLKKFVFKKRI